MPGYVKIGMTAGPVEEAHGEIGFNWCATSISMF